MKIQTFSKLIRQSAHTIQLRIQKGEIPAKLVRLEGVWGGFKYWDIDEDYVKKMIE